MYGEKSPSAWEQGTSERMTGHLEAEGMSSEILGREAEEGRRPRQGGKMREARTRAGEPAVWPGEQPALMSCPPTAQRDGLFPPWPVRRGPCDWIQRRGAQRSSLSSGHHVKAH